MYQSVLDRTLKCPKKGGDVAWPEGFAHQLFRINYLETLGIYSRESNGLYLYRSKIVECSCTEKPYTEESFSISRK